MRPRTGKTVCKVREFAYVETDFASLRDIKSIFSQTEFTSIGFTPMKVIKQVFGSKEKYFALLNELENKLYE